MSSIPQNESTWEQSTNWILTIASAMGVIEFEFSNIDNMLIVAKTIIAELESQDKRESMKINFVPIAPGLTEAIKGTVNITPSEEWLGR